MDPLMAAAVLLGYFVKGICGFANTLVFTTVMSFRMDNVNLSPIDLLVGFPANLLMVWKERRHTRLRVWGPLAAMVVLGAVPGALLLKSGGAGMVKLGFGLMVVVLGAEMLLRERRPATVGAPRWALWLIGLLSGLLCGLYGVGALLAAYIGRTSENASQFRGDLCVVFTVDGAFRIALYSLMGILTVPAALTALQLLPFMLAGMGLGVAVSRRASEKWVRRVVIVALIFSGVALILGNL
ncbi:MAG: sulfite exporter TauE/SafE family protein [Clostridiales bacterium]|nr:sulfite exporter TauE/SafE family protein [Clostridiales bacterium]